MQLSIFQIDAFTNEIFRGNPACVVPLDAWLEDAILLKIAQENAVAETAFFIVQKKEILLRWFSPLREIDLCGHATLATAFCLFNCLNIKKSQYYFSTKSGILTVSTATSNWFSLDFPSRPAQPIKLPPILEKALSIQPKKVLKARDYLLVFEDEVAIKNIKIDKAIFDSLDMQSGGVILTAKGKETDFVSRFFIPKMADIEDPVTGSAHCTLIPYWAEQFNKNYLIAQQISNRGGYLRCIYKQDRVLISGQARLYLEGTIWIE